MQNIRHRVGGRLKRERGYVYFFVDYGYDCL